MCPEVGEPWGPLQRWKSFCVSFKSCTGRGFLDCLSGKTINARKCSICTQATDLLQGLGPTQASLQQVAQIAENPRLGAAIAGSHPHGCPHPADRCADWSPHHTSARHQDLETWGAGRRWDWLFASPQNVRLWLVRSNL